MAEKIEIFPSNRIQALTMLYLENQDLSKMSPEDLADLYVTTYKKIFNQSRRNIKSN